MAQLNAYLHFNGNAKEAMAFYKGILGGELTLQAARESPMGARMSPEMKDKMLHSMLKNNDLVLMASDMMGEEQVQGNMISLCFVCDSEEEINTLFAKFSDGGKVGHPLKEESFGIFGDLTDKFGINWMFQLDIQKIERCKEG